MPNPIGNTFIAALLRSPLHKLLGESFGLITVTGRKTGRRISTPINAVRMGEGFAVVSYRRRTWWRNLAGGRTGALRVGGKTIPVTGRVVEDPAEVRNGLREYFKIYPAYAKYFDIRCDVQGRIPEEELERVAKDRVIIRLMPG
ncbi:MAG: nitroreductase family deazaflavin-dependent oxidoreductase [Anaerolineales bacterium]|nr:nitroreductase family deazaflavin-dependent oxidoreductase [Anaerolineales bacterium]